ncbi:MAG: alpha/beta hydrolase [Taibaiella sp.]|nr:alpha/beta hydrolase [Taibaiella sp.]
MYRILTIFLLLVSATPGLGQEYPYNKETWWNRLVLEKNYQTDLTVVDTSIIVVTNRWLTQDSLRFMSEERGDGKLLYFFVYAHEGRWHVLQVNDLGKAISLVPHKHKDWVVYTEGMGKIFTAEVNRGMMMASQHNVNVIMLDYPSITTTKKQLGNYLFAIKNARHCYEDYVPVLHTIKANKLTGKMGHGNLSLFFHSMGNYLIRQAAKKNQLGQLNSVVWVDNIILNAPCVPQAGHAKWLDKITFAENIYIQYNPEDRTLYWPELINKKNQLGRKLKGPLSNKAHYVNFNKLVGQEHSYFITLRQHKPIQDEVWQYYNTVLHCRPVDFNHGKYTTSSYNSIGYEILP